MANYKIYIQYDGTRYKGWQRQRTTDQTIQGKIEAILTRRYGRTIEIDGSGRTDAGVHAHGQVANFRIPETLCDGKLPEEVCDELLELFAEYLPEDIAVTEVRVASARFHSRLNVVKKTYVYISGTRHIPMCSNENLCCMIRGIWMWKLCVRQQNICLENMILRRFVEMQR